MRITWDNSSTGFRVLEYMEIWQNKHLQTIYVPKFAGMSLKVVKVFGRRRKCHLHKARDIHFLLQLSPSGEALLKAVGPRRWRERLRRGLLQIDNNMELLLPLKGLHGPAHQIIKFKRGLLGQRLDRKREGLLHSQIMRDLKV